MYKSSSSLRCIANLVFIVINWQISGLKKYYPPPPFFKEKKSIKLKINSNHGNYRIKPLLHVHFVSHALYHKIFRHISPQAQGLNYLLEKDDFFSLYKVNYVLKMFVVDCSSLQLVFTNKKLQTW